MAIKWNIFYDGNTCINARFIKSFCFQAEDILFKSIYIFHVCTPQRSLMISVLVPCCVVVVIGEKIIYVTSKVESNTIFKFKFRCC